MRKINYVHDKFEIFKVEDSIYLILHSLKGSSFYSKVVISGLHPRLCWQPKMLLARPLPFG
jgi:hypothetical protein